jgi:tetratricopeptide (TPR) repeat protein
VPNLDHSLANLERHIRSGNLAAAENLLTTPGTSLDDFLAKWPRESLDGMKAATAIAELQFMLGHDDVAKRCLESYSDDHALITAPLAARHKLQIAEYHYSSFNLPKAISLGELILNGALSVEDRAGVAEARFYLARFKLRSDAYKEANDECMLGLESLHRAKATTDEDRQAVRWQTGRLLRVRGTALWQQGRLTEAKAVLYLSAWILRDAFGTSQSLHVGDALLALGRLLRSDDSTRHEEALAMLEEAKLHYADHDLKVARTLIDLARTRHNMAVAQLGAASVDQARTAALFKASRESLEDALEIVKRRCQAQNPPKVWRRTRAEARLWRCWLTLEAPNKNRNLRQAHEDAQAAFDETTEIGSRKSDFVETKIALGHCEMELRNFDLAKEWFEDALGQADELEQQNPKLRMHACLSLAQRECRANGSVKTAQGHLDDAFHAVNGTAEISNYLSAKAATVRREIHNLASARSSLVLTLDTLIESTPDGWIALEVLEVQARKWALDALGKDVSNAKAAQVLGKTAGTYKNIKTEAKELEEAQRQAALKRNNQGN